ncbi:alanine racemase [Aliidiomarina minuta]|uniref:Alanine racemase n=1 Tax=Aliidiomarina minuta TaxID=880057 RepID=A0A432W9P2_9GAMM|nr:alanine racemase [Aliidiomarina minuta]RUO26819.1 alanine racemase [Aliidiomarina minuta]
MSTLNWQHITGPRILVDTQRAKRNIQRMQAHADSTSVSLRPHFKTHQSVDIGRWFREAGTQAIAVSSVTMAQQFEKAGWRDIMIAIPLNPRELSAINRLAADTRLTLCIEHEDALNTLSRLSNPVDVMLEVDAGYGRTGLDCAQQERIQALALSTLNLPQVKNIGLLLHAGNSYQARGDDEIAQIHQQSLSQVRQLADFISLPDGHQLFISVGDTPTCSRMKSFPGADEIRPGNYVFYDLMQQHIGACEWDDIALTLACPIIARYPERNEVVVHGGAVHFSKDYIQRDGAPCYGQVMKMTDQGWAGEPVEGAFVHGLSQEHGKVRMPAGMAEQMQLGDLLVIAPAHSCLTMAAMREFVAFG